jgi:phospholipid/cholesterol/gamma-HCH transport system substrate-binding protein
MAPNGQPAQASYERRGRAREVWVGLFVLLGVGAALLLIFMMTEPAMFRGRYLVTTYVPDAGGIRNGDPVQMRGVVIGRVSGFAIDVERGQVGVRLELLRGAYRVPRDSSVELRSRSIYGEMVAEIRPGKAPDDLRGGEVLPGRLTRDLFSGGPQMARKAEDVVTRMQALLSDQTIAGVETSTSELTALLRKLNGLAAEQREELSALTRSLRASAEAVENATAGPELKLALQRANATLVELESAADSLERASHSLDLVLGRIERGEGTLGRMLKDDELYQNLNRALQNTSRLAADVQARPERYVKLSLF